MTTDIKDHMSTIFDMTVEDIKQKANNNPSIQLRQMVIDMVMTYKLRVEEREKQVKAIIDQGRSEGLEDTQIKDLIITTLKKNGLSPSTVYRALPDELKDKHMQEVRSHRVVEQITTTTDDSDMTLEQLRERNRQRVLGDTDQSRPVIGEAQVIYSREDKDKTPLPDQPLSTSGTAIDRVPEGETVVGYNDKIMHNTEPSTNLVIPPVPDESDIPAGSAWIVHNQPSDYTTQSNLIINMPNGKFQTVVNAHCYPDKKTVRLDPVDKSSIVKVHE